jgi:hypothetical protein
MPGSGFNLTEEINPRFFCRPMTEYESGPGRIVPSRTDDRLEYITYCQIVEGKPENTFVSRIWPEFGRKCRIFHFVRNHCMFNDFLS